VEIHLGSNLLYNLQSLSILLNGGIPCAILPPLFWFIKLFMICWVTGLSLPIYNLLLNNFLKSKFPTSL
jgi:hypothetical protein